MIKTFDYLKIFSEIESEIFDAIQRVLLSGKLILGPETDLFEKEFADHLGVANCVGVSSGTTALHLALLAMNIGPGDEVITVSNTCVPTISSIRLTGAKPIFVDVRDEDLMIDPEKVEKALSKNTKCIIPVHLWGQGADINKIMKSAKQEGIHVLEDCAQAQGTYIQDRHAGTIGTAGCFSFYPTKNLGSYGDAGAIITNDDEFANLIKLKRTYGYSRPNFAETLGMNARISEIQAAILRVKLRYLPTWLKRRSAIAERYLKEINNPKISLPKSHKERKHAYHQFVIRSKNRDETISVLKANSIEHNIHYPTPVHLMPAYNEEKYLLPVTEKASHEILSIPIHESLGESEVEHIINTLNNM